MTTTQTSYLITIDEPNENGVMADTFSEALIFVGRLIERLYTDDKFNGKHIHVTEYLNENGNCTTHDNLFTESYLIEK